MKAAKALVYLEGSMGIETVTVEFRCWEQLYALIQSIQCANPSKKAGLEEVIDPIPHNFPIFEWQISSFHRLSARSLYPLAKPRPLIIR